VSENIEKKQAPEDSSENIKSSKKRYVKPQITTEDLVTFGALCNGTSNAGRKATTISCNRRKLNS
jgi:hypothetical protein